MRGWESRFPRRKTEMASKGQWHTERREMNITQPWHAGFESSATEHVAVSFRGLRCPAYTIGCSLCIGQEWSLCMCATQVLQNPNGGLVWDLLQNLKPRVRGPDSLFKLIKSGSKTRPDSRRHTMLISVLTSLTHCQVVAMSRYWSRSACVTQRTGSGTLTQC